MAQEGSRKIICTKIVGGKKVEYLTKTMEKQGWKVKTERFRMKRRNKEPYVNYSSLGR